MAMLDSLKDTLNKSVAAVSVKSETLVESSRVKSAMGGAQKRLEAEKAALGIKLYQAWKAGTASMDIFAEDFARIQGIEEELAGLNTRLAQIKAEEDRILGAAQRPAAPAAPAASGAPAAPAASGAPAAPAAPAAAAPAAPAAPAAAAPAFCTNCGKPLAAGSRFCIECGTPVT